MGRIDLDDWAMLNLTSNGLAGSLIASALSATTVPEPSSLAMMAAFAVAYDWFGSASQQIGDRPPYSVA